jgi:hypothetical protein
MLAVTRARLVAIGGASALLTAANASAQTNRQVPPAIPHSDPGALQPPLKALLLKFALVYAGQFRHDLETAY